MYPGTIGWWRSRRGHDTSGDEHGCGAHAGGGCGHRRRGRHHGHSHGVGPWQAGPGGEGGFGVRRPLRFLRHKLELDDKQVSELARILDELKTERAQAAVDDRRARGDLAASISADSFDKEKAEAATKSRAEAAARLETSVLQALEQIHALLDSDQREVLSYLLRTGALSI